MATLRLRIKNLRALYSLRPTTQPEYARLVTAIREPHESIREKLSALLDTHEGEMPVQAVRDLAQGFVSEAVQCIQAPIPPEFAKRPIRREFLQFALLYRSEVYHGIAQTLNAIADQFDPDKEGGEVDLEESMRRWQRDDEEGNTQE